MEYSFEFDDGDLSFSMYECSRKLTHQQQLLSKVTENQLTVQPIDFSWDLPCGPKQTSYTFTAIAPNVFKNIRKQFGVSERDFAVCNITEANDNN